MIRVRRIVEPPWKELEALVAESEAEGFHFLVRLRDEWRSGANRFDQPGEVFLIAERDGVPAGLCGLNRNPFGYSPDTGRVRRLYVSAKHRRRGVARALVHEIIACARPHYRRLVLRTNNSGADAFYESMGFRPRPEANSTHRLVL